MSQGGYYDERNRYSYDDDSRYARDPYRERMDQPRGYRENSQGYGRRQNDQAYPSDPRGYGDESFGEGSLDYYPGKDRDYPSYTNEAYDRGDEPEPHRVYGRRNDPGRGFGDDRLGHARPGGQRHGPYGGENKPNNLRPDLEDEDDDDGGFGGNRARHVSADDVIRNNPDQSRERHASDGHSNLHDRSVDSRMTRSSGMDNLASAAGPPPREEPTETRAIPVVTLTPGKWAYPIWLPRPALILGGVHIALGALLFIFGCIEASFNDRVLTSAGQGILSGFVILAAGIVAVLSATKVAKGKKTLIHVTIGCTACGFLTDFIVFGMCAQSISNLNEAQRKYISTTSNIGGNVARPNYDFFYAVHGLLIIFAFAQLLVGLVMLLYFIMALLPPKHQYEYIKPYVYTAADGTNAREASEPFYPELLCRPAILTGATQIVLGVLVLIFGCVEASFHGSQKERPPGVTAAEGVWGGVIMICAGVVTISAAKFKIKLLVIATITATVLAIIVDIIIFGICGYTVSQMNSLMSGGLYGAARRHYDLWFAIYDILIVFAFIHIVIALVSVFIHTMVFFPSKFFKRKGSRPAATQARVTGRYQSSGQNGVPMSDRRTQPTGPDPRQEALRNIYAPDDNPPRYDDLPPSPDPYNTAAGYDLAFATGAHPKLPAYSERAPDSRYPSDPQQQPRQGTRYGDDYAPYPGYDDEPRSPNRPEPPREYEPSNAPYRGGQEPQPYERSMPYSHRSYGDQAPGYPHDRDENEGSRHPSDRDSYGHDRSYSEDSAPYERHKSQHSDDHPNHRNPRPDYNDRGRSEVNPSQYYGHQEPRQYTRDYDGGYDERSHRNVEDYREPLPRFADRGSTGV